MKHKIDSQTVMVTCDTCKDAIASHWSGYRDLCCACYVAEGNPPADWHEGCMKAYGDKSGAAQSTPQEKP